MRTLAANEDVEGAGGHPDRRRNALPPEASAPWQAAQPEEVQSVHSSAESPVRGASLQHSTPSTHTRSQSRQQNGQQERGRLGDDGEVHVDDPVIKSEPGKHVGGYASRGGDHGGDAD